MSCNRKALFMFLIVVDFFCSRLLHHKKNCAGAAVFHWYFHAQVVWGDFVNLSIVLQRILFCSSSHFSLSPGAEASVRLDKASAIAAPARFRIHLIESFELWKRNWGHPGGFKYFNRKIHQNLGNRIVISTYLHQERCVSHKVGLCFMYIPRSCDQNPCRVTENDSETEHTKRRQAIEFSMTPTWYMYLYHSMLKKNVAMSECPKSATRQTLLYFFWHKVTFCAVQPCSPCYVPTFPSQKKRLPGCSTLLPFICSMYVLLHLSKTRWWFNFITCQLCQIKQVHEGKIWMRLPCTENQHLKPAKTLVADRTQNNFWIRSCVMQTHLIKVKPLTAGP